MKYQKPAMLGLLGLGLIASPLFIKLPQQFHTFAAISNLEAQESVERSRIEQRKLTSDKLNATGILPTSLKLRIRGYLDNPKRNPRPDTSYYQESELVYVYDSGGRCIGQIAERRWLWKYHYKNVCNLSPQLEESKQ
ncbi:hypothetical protein H6G33_37270 [Calothrix sp. FACHB-1219]|uniref:hypothetical protein n=1 Tax=unclassified Calothrix TaxID=2619626 RepID=UPI00168A0E76|nr:MULTISPECIES: hypothetical protein [unclassified Calothrix]MBD2208008.1 hypothetical protein [Calothrix sp. FACHB-168]MBD2222579.1 hypothetical protein [Calothrix sp. FACHB-1219]